LYGYLRLMGGLHIAFCCILYVSVFQPSCYSGTLHKRDDHSRNLMHRTNGDLGVKLLKLTIKQQAKACLIWPYKIILFSNFISNVESKSLLHLTKNTLQGGRQQPFSSLPPTQKMIIGSFTYYMEGLGQPRESRPPSYATLLREAFYKQNVSGS